MHHVCIAFVGFITPYNVLLVSASSTGWSPPQLRLCMIQGAVMLPCSMSPMTDTCGVTPNTLSQDVLTSLLVPKSPSECSIDTNTSNTSGRWSPPPQRPQQIFCPLPSPLLLLTQSSMLVSPHPASTIDSDTDREEISWKHLWPRVIGTSLTTHSRVLEKGKAQETKSDEVTCLKVAEGKFVL